MDPETRTLIRVTIDDLARAERRVSVLMGDKVAPRQNNLSKITLNLPGRKRRILSCRPEGNVQDRVRGRALNINRY